MFLSESELLTKMCSVFTPASKRMLDSRVVKSDSKSMILLFWSKFVTHSVLIGNGEPTLLVQCWYQMLPLNHKRTTSSLAPPLFCIFVYFVTRRHILYFVFQEGGVGVNRFAVESVDKHGEINILWELLKDNDPTLWIEGQVPIINEGEKEYRVQSQLIIFITVFFNLFLYTATLHGNEDIWLYPVVP